MPNLNDPINDNAEFSGSSPKRTRPTDKQMGLGTHDFLNKKDNEKKDKKSNT